MWSHLAQSAVIFKRQIVLENKAKWNIFSDYWKFLNDSEILEEEILWLNGRLWAKMWLYKRSHVKQWVNQCGRDALAKDYVKKMCTGASLSLSPELASHRDHLESLPSSQISRELLKVQYEQKLQIMFLFCFQVL